MVFWVSKKIRNRRAMSDPVIWGEYKLSDLVKHSYVSLKDISDEDIDELIGCFKYYDEFRKRSEADPYVSELIKEENLNYYIVDENFRVCIDDITAIDIAYRGDLPCIQSFISGVFVENAKPAEIQVWFPGGDACLYVHQFIVDAEYKAIVDLWQNRKKIV